MKRLLVPFLLVVSLSLSACAGVAGVVRDVIENDPTASLTYVLATAGGPGLAFDPGPEVGRGVIVIADAATSLELLSTPDGAECLVSTKSLECRLGDVDEVVFIGVTGDGVLASASFRRAGSSAERRVFARLPD